MVPFCLTQSNCKSAFELLPKTYNVCNGWQEAVCRFIHPPGRVFGTYLCTVKVSNVIRSFEDCAPALGRPTLGEESITSTTPSVPTMGGNPKMLCFTTPRMQTEDPRKKRRLSPPAPVPHAIPDHSFVPTFLESSWDPPVAESSRARVKKSETRPRRIADAASQGIYGQTLISS